MYSKHPALFTDLYELKMLEAYLREGMTGEAIFTVFIRRVPPQRNFLLACGLDTVLEYLENVRFDEADIEYLSSLGHFSKELLDSLRHFRFEGEVRAVPEGTPVFANEPILEIRAPIAQAQLVETYVTNQIHLQTLLASKASRVVLAAQGRPVVDFGARRMHGIDAALKAARAFYIAGVVSTSNVLAGQLYGLPVAGTMAHSYVQAHDLEMDAFRAFARTYPDTTLLVDTYDTLDGVRRVIQLARELGEAFQIQAVRLDSGDLVELARESRKLLDAAGLQRVKIFASGGLDEYEVAKLVREAPVDAFGVGTSMGVSADKPDLDIVYKLAEYEGRGRLKLATDKPVLPGAKQVFRFEENGVAVRDVIARADEQLGGRPLLECVMRGGKRLDSARRTLDQMRDYAREQIAKLPAALHALETAAQPYQVEISDALAEHQRELQRELAQRQNVQL
ncbi:MAG: nicotinate phosphoribosyltransferase [Gammaproteobacteria bacterium]|nr:nicotinate phosphoribosyltransferase [Gammaproteobacteria bacterium]